MTNGTLARITAGKLTSDQLWRARLAICQHVRGASEIGPRWRLGSNNPWSARDADLFSDAPVACPFCGADGQDLVGTGATGVGVEYCRACGTDWIVGDYDWTKLSDCIRYRDDFAAGLIDEGQR